MLNFSKNKLDSLAIGAAILGSGGGGSTDYPLLTTANMLETYGDISLLNVNELQDDDLVVPLGFMGAPLVGLEKIRNELELETIIQAISKDYNRPLKALSVTEIGGGNAFTPFYIAGKLDLPILDADLIGRAFPELQMISPTVYNLQSKRCYMADVFGNVIKLECNNMQEVEKYARHMTVAFGSSAAIVLHVFTGKEAKEVMVKDSISKACALGDIILTAKKLQQKPLEAILNYTNGKMIGSGMIKDINQSITAGFLTGKVQVQSDCTEWQIEYQNEYLFIHQNQKIAAQTPDIIALLDEETGVPLSSDSLTYGARVDIISFKAPDLWYTSSGLNLVGPQYFKKQI